MTVYGCTGLRKDPMKELVGLLDSNLTASTALTSESEVVAQTINLFSDPVQAASLVD